MRKIGALLVVTAMGANGCSNSFDGTEREVLANASAALTSNSFPQDMLMEHHSWHGAHSPAQNSDVDQGVDFFSFHTAFIKMGRAWFLTQPGVTAPMLESWTTVPSELKTPAHQWNSNLDAAVQRIETNNPPFSGENELGDFINYDSGIHGFLHYASATEYGEPILGNFSSPQSTYFYKIHGLIDRWWDGWRAQAYDPTSGGPSAVMAGARLWVFGRGATSQLMHRYYDAGWQPWLPLDENLASGPSAVMSGNMLVVFARGPKNVLVHKYYSNGWSPWVPLDGSAPGPGQVTANVTATNKGIMTSAPSAVMAGTRLTVFARGPDNTLIHRYYENGWTNWIALGPGALSSSPSAVMLPVPLGVPGFEVQLMVFARDAAGGLIEKFYVNNIGWVDWIPVGGDVITSAPAAVVAGTRLVVFARRSDNTLTHRYFDWATEGGWTDWIPLGGAPISSAPTAVMANGRLTVFARDMSNQLTHRYYDGGWTGWIALGGQL